MFVIWLALAYWCVSISAKTYYDLNQADKYFEQTITIFKKNYKPREKENHFDIFKNNLREINIWNNESDNAVFDITGFTDISDKDLKKYKGLPLYHYEDNDCHMVYDDGIQDIPNPPESFDWREHKKVTRVKFQDYCASSWAFGAVGHLESQYAIKYNETVELSEQMVIDCDRISDGCCGGYPSNAFRTVNSIGGMMLEKDYPYEQAKYICEATAQSVPIKVTECYSFNLKSQEKVKQLLLQYGPIPIGIRTNKILHHYVSGIIPDEYCSDDNASLDHVVLLVGYGTEKGIPYWIVKNSWGPGHGESGYFRMQRSDNPAGACGMLNTVMAIAVIA